MENDVPVLTVAILEANHYNNWEPALTYPLPRDPSIDLIDTAIDEILNYLSFVTSEVAQKNATQARREIEHAAARLIELAEAKPKAFSAWLQECERESSSIGRPSIARHATHGFRCALGREIVVPGIQMAVKSSQFTSSEAR